MFRYRLIDLKKPNFQEQELISNAHDLWIKTYGPIFSEAQEKFNPEEFFQKKWLALLHEERRDMAGSPSEIIGLHLYDFFDLSKSEDRESPYFRQLPQGFFDKYIQGQFTLIMSGEYLTVSPPFRGKKTKIPFSQVIVSLCAKVFLNSSAELVIGISRKDKKVDQLTKNLGAEPKDQINCHKISCEIMVARRQDISTKLDPMLQNLVESLWNHRIQTPSIHLITDTTEKESAA
jgi:hypothetical protein